ncbi:MAG: hypothetical protein LBD12_00975 [Clostridiales Family XIII bacterium]|jgi:hypothetical protein|nr:hypothetical protein [Clostridiales Family XIII bacterium]
METSSKNGKKEHRKRNVLRRVLPIALSLALVITLVSAGVMTAYAHHKTPLTTARSGDWKYGPAEGGGIQIEWVGKKSVVKIPNKLKGKKVVEAFILEAYMGKKVKKVDATAARSLTYLEVNSWGMTSIDLSKSTALKTLNLYNAPLKSLNLSAAMKLEDFELMGSKIRSIGLANHTRLKGILIRDSSYLRTLTVNGCRSLDQINMSGTKVGALNFTGDNKLRAAYVSDNRIKKLTLPAKACMTHLGFDRNPGLQVDAKSQKSTLIEVYYSVNGVSTRVQIKHNEWDWSAGSIFKNT